MFVRILLFLSAYTPMFLIAAIRFPGAIIGGVGIGLTVLGLLSLVRLLQLMQGRAASQPARSIELVDVHEEGAYVAAYLVTFVLPLFVTQFSTPRDLVAYGVFVLLLAVLSGQTALAQVNPLLRLCGVRILRVRTEAGAGSFVLSRQLPVVAGRLDAVDLAPRLLVATG